MELYASETTLMSEVTDYSMRRCIIARLQDVVLYRYVSIIIYIVRPIYVLIELVICIKK
jgi:hypothetical protein